MTPPPGRRPPIARPLVSQGRGRAKRASGHSPAEPRRIERGKLGQPDAATPTRFRRHVAQPLKNDVRTLARALEAVQRLDEAGQRGRDFRRLLVGRVESAHVERRDLGTLQLQLLHERRPCPDPGPSRILQGENGPVHRPAPSNRSQKPNCSESARKTRRGRLVGRLAGGAGHRGPGAGCRKVYVPDEAHLDQTEKHTHGLRKQDIEHFSLRELDRNRYVKAQLAQGPRQVAVTSEHLERHPPAGRCRARRQPLSTRLGSNGARGQSARRRRNRPTFGRIRRQRCVSSVGQPRQPAAHAVGAPHGPRHGLRSRNHHAARLELAAVRHARVAVRRVCARDDVPPPPGPRRSRAATRSCI